MRAYLACLCLAVLPAAAAGPSITGLSPNPIDAGGPYFPLTISGSGFVNGSVARWGNHILSTTYPGRSDQLIAQITPELRVIASNYFLTVTNPNGAVSNKYAITVSPVLSFITPFATAAGSGALSVTIEGIGFQPALALQISTPNGPVTITPTVLDSGTMTATIPAGALATPRTATVQIVDTVYGGVSGTLPFEIRGTPSITGASPNPIDAGGGYFLLNVTGTGFVPGLLVKWGTVPLGTSYVSATQLQAAITPELRILAGGFKLTINDPATGAASTSYTETVAPVLFGINPATAPVGSAALAITATGAGFTANTVLTAGQSAIQTTYVSATTLTGVVPASALRTAGSVSLQVFDTAGGGRSLPQLLTLSPGAPWISNLFPNAVRAGSSSFSLMVSGNNFVNGAVVQWNGAALPTTFLNATQLTATVAASLVQAAGTVTIGVSIAGAPTATSTFTITAPPPVLISISPASITAGSATFTLTATGSNCGPGCLLQWNGTPLTTSVLSTTQVSAAVPASLVASAGTVMVRMVNSAGAASNTAPFVINPPAPTLTGISPSSIPAGNSPVILTVKGVNFATGALVLWNGSPVPTTFQTSGQLIAEVPAAMVSGLLSAVVTVSNPGGAVSNALAVAIQLPGPSIATLAPSFAPAGSAAFTLTVSGQNFAVNCVVRWNGAPVYTTLVSATQATAAITADLVATPGLAFITLANPNGMESSAATFNVVSLAPAISALNPASAFIGAAAFTLVVSGTNFPASSRVMWDGEALATTFVSSTELHAEVPAERLTVAGLASITVSSPGVSTLNAAIFTVGVPRPTATSAGIVNAATGRTAIAPGTLISIYGVNLALSEAAAQSLPLPLLLNGTSVTIDGVAAPLLFVSPGQINAQVPWKTQPGGATLRIQAGGLESVDITFDVSPVAPGLWPASPAPVPVGQYVTVYGTGQGLVDASEPFALPLAPVTAQVGNQQARVTFAGMAPGTAGVLQVNLVVPPVNPGRQELTIIVGGVKSNAVPLWVQ